MADNPKFVVTKLNNSNYFAWKFKMKLLLAHQKVWDAVSTAAPTTVTTEWTGKDSKAYAIIGLQIEDDQLVHIRETTTAKDAWDALQAYHEKATVNSKFRLLKNVMRMRLDENGDMEAHIACINESFQQLTDLSTSMTADNWKSAAMLGSLPESYDNLVTLMESRPEGELTASKVQATLIDEYRRRVHKEGNGVQAQNSAFLANRRYGANHAAKEKFCFKCKGKGHYKNECPQKQEPSVVHDAKKGKSWKYNKSSAHFVKERDGDSDEYLFVASTKNRDGWIIDSGSTSHITHNRGILKQFNPNFADKVYLANGDRVEARGKGIVTIDVLNNVGKKHTVTLTDVLYIPSVNTNLISVKKLISRGLEVKFNDQMECLINKQNKQIALGRLDGNLFILNEENKACTVTQHQRNCIHVWHRVCGHRDIEIVKRLVSDGHVTGIHIADCNIKESCDVCAQGKMTRVKFPKVADNHSKSVLDLVHTDVCGPMHTETPGKKKYILTFIDDFSKYTVVYLLNQKSEVFRKLQHFIEMATNMFNKRPKILRSDRGGEYTGKEVRAYLKSKGVQIQYTAAYSPQQNGVAERKNRTLVEMSRCMLLDADMPFKFWGEAVMMANHLQNRLPTKGATRTPFEGWFGFKPNINYFHRFGAKCYVRIPDEKRRKLEKKAETMILVGYDNESKAYRCYNQNTNSVIISRDVRFVIENDSIFPYADDVEDDPVEKDGASQKGNIEGNSTDLHRDNGSVTEPSKASKDEPSKVNDDEQSYASDDDADQTLTNELDLSQSAPAKIMTRRFSARIKERQQEMHLAKQAIPKPDSYQDAVTGPNKDEWLTAMQEEMDSLNQNGTWILTELPKDRKAIGCKWVYTCKYLADGSVARFKARLVAQGFSQKYGTDYDAVFAPVVRQASFRTLLAVAAKKEMIVLHFDAKTAFLNGELQEEIFMRQPPGFHSNDKDQVCLLKRSLYGLKQSARVWNQTLHQVLIGGGFKQSDADQCLYTKIKGSGKCFILIYVDDLAIASNQNELLLECEKLLKNHFEIQNLGPIQKYLGIEIERDKQGNFLINQSSYINEVASEFGLIDARNSPFPLSTGYEKEVKSNELDNNEKYQRLIGSLLYIATNTRPDIAASISILAQKTSRPTENDWIELKRVVRYLKGTADHKLKLIEPENQMELEGYADANWAESQVDRKSNSGYIFFVYGAAISWSCRKQKCVALSSTEAEYIALCDATQELIWLRSLLKDFGIQQVCSTTIYEDNQSCLKLAESDKPSIKLKHIGVKRHFVKDHIDRQTVNLEYCPTEFMLADMLTKPLNGVRIKIVRENCGLKEI